MASFTTSVDEQFRGSGLTDGDSLTHMYRPFCKATLAASGKHIRLKAGGMTGEYWRTEEVAEAERERDELRERLGIHSEEYKANSKSHGVAVQPTDQGDD